MAVKNAYPTKLSRVFETNALFSGYRWFIGIKSDARINAEISKFGHAATFG